MSMVVARPADIALDPDQQYVADLLTGRLDRRGKPRRRQRGIYLHGLPGRGKTMLVDRFYASIPHSAKARWHFHSFFARLHTAIHELGSLENAIATLLGKARLVVFDEFHVHDIGDAVLITRLLERLFSRRILLILTSNYPPQGLLPNPLFHHSFVPTINRIEDELDVVALNGPLDYRTTTPQDRSGFSAGQYQLTHRIDGPQDRKRTLIHLGNRGIQACWTHDGTVGFDFADLCGTPTSAADYVRLTEQYREWTLYRVPLLRQVPPDHAMRFIILIDVLYDADMPCTITAAGPINELLAGVGDTADAGRLASRLHQLSRTS